MGMMGRWTEIWIRRGACVLSVSNYVWHIFLSDLLPSLAMLFACPAWRYLVGAGVHICHC